MASNMALKRAAKANRRKAVVAEKRKLELLNDTLSAKVLRAVQAPIRHCFVPERLFDIGIGTVILARGNTPGYLAVGGFLIDTWCLGVKDTFFHSGAAEAFDRMMARMDATTPIASVDPSYARKLLRDAAAWAASFGFAPHRDFAAIEHLFGDVKADACDATFVFGRKSERGSTELSAQAGLRLGEPGHALGADGPDSAEFHANL